MFKKVEKTSKIYEFWYLFLLIIGICIGSGVYLKNQELIKQTNSPVIAVVLWLIIGLVCVVSIVSFIEIAKSTQNQGNGTVSNWSKLFLNRKIASLYSVFHVFLYVPAYQSIFVSCSILYFLNACNFVLTGLSLLVIFLAIGVFLFISFAVINVYAPLISKNMQMGSIIIKFVPLIIAFLAGFILFFAGKGTENAMGSKGDVVAWNFFGGFGAILFSFDGYIFTANTQKNAKNKEVVTKAIMIGLIFITLFYVLMALSLFLGGDGSVESVLIKIFSGGVADPTPQVAEISRVLTCVIMMTIFTLNINMFTHFGISGFISDHNMKLIYLPEKDRSFKMTAFIQAIVSISFYSFLIMAALFSTRKDWIGILAKPNGTDPQSIGQFNANAMFYIGQMASVAVVLLFGIIASLIMAAMINRFTGKVKVEKVKYFWPCSIIAFIAMVVLNFFGLLVFLIPDLFTAEKQGWVKSGGMLFTVIFLVSILAVMIVWLIQEWWFTKKPFENGFIGEVDPSMATNNWMTIVNNSKKSLGLKKGRQSCKKL